MNKQQEKKFNEYKYLVTDIYNKYFSYYTYLEEDILQEGFQSLTNRIVNYNKFKNNFKNNVPKFIFTGMFWYISKDSSFNKFRNEIKFLLKYEYILNKYLPLQSKIKKIGYDEDTDMDIYHIVKY